MPPQPNWTPEEAAAVSRAGQPNPDISPPDTFASAAPLPNSRGWNRSDVTVTISATDPDGASDVAHVGYRAGGSRPIGPTWVPGASTTVQISAEGQTPLTFYSRDRAGNTDVATTLRLSIDKTAPALTMPTLAASYPYNAPLTLNFGASDAVSGLASKQATSTATR